jgi:hypothetical protein
VRLTNDPNPSSSGGFADLFRLQADFQARMARETLHYLRRVQGALSPAAPGTVVAPDGETGLVGSAPPGGSVRLRLEIENRQRVHCVVTPMLAPLVEASGTTWFPSAEVSPAAPLVPPGEVATLTLLLPVPRELPTGTYRGALLLQGFRDGGILVTVNVSGPGRGENAKVEKPRARPAARKRRRGSRRGASRS